MWVLFNGISTTDTFRIEVVCHVEYIPTLPFGSWSPPESPSLSEDKLTSFLKEVRSLLPEAVNGDLGRKVAGAMETGRKFGKAMALVASVF